MTTWLLNISNGPARYFSVFVLLVCQGYYDQVHWQDNCTAPSPELLPAVFTTQLASHVWPDHSTPHHQPDLTTLNPPGGMSQLWPVQTVLQTTLGLIKLAESAGGQEGRRSRRSRGNRRAPGEFVFPLQWPGLLEVSSLVGGARWGQTIRSHHLTTSPRHQANIVLGPAIIIKYIFYWELDCHFTRECYQEISQRCLVISCCTLWCSGESFGKLHGHG